VPSEIGKALEGLGSTMNSLKGIPDQVEGPRTRVDMGSSVPDVPELADWTLRSTHVEVAAAIADKMERRHPHLFGAAEQGGHHLWEQIKAEERGAKGHASALDGIASALPALMRAEKLAKRAARVGFDWPNLAQVVDKIHEELYEVAEAAAGGGRDRLEDEIGDLLFAVVNLARYLEIDGETALRAANRKFERRFRRVEAILAERGREPADSTLGEMEAAWRQAKSEDR